MTRISKAKQEKLMLADQKGVREVWDAAARAGFDRMDNFQKSYTNGFAVTRRKDLAGDIMASARILESFAHELLILGFKPKVWEKDDLNYQYAKGSFVVSFGTNRKGVHLYAAVW